MKHAAPAHARETRTGTAGLDRKEAALYRILAQDAPQERGEV